MIGPCSLRGQKQKQNIDGLTVESIEIDRLFQAGDEAEDPIQPGKLAMRDGDAVADPGRAEALALQQRLENLVRAAPDEPPGQRAEFVQRLLLAVDLQGWRNGIGAEEGSQGH